MSIELGMKVRIKDTCEVNAGFTGVVESILHNKLLVAKAVMDFFR